MCLVKTLLGKTLWEKILVKEKEYTYLLIRTIHTICCLIKNLARKTQWEKTSIKGKRVQRVLYSPWLKHHLISCDDVSNLRTLWLIYSFFEEKPHISWIWCVILSQPDALLTCFMEDFYFYRATFASLIPRILLCLHMQTHSVIEIELYADQINILHLRNQSILSWIPRDRINP